MMTKAQMPIGMPMNTQGLNRGMQARIAPVFAKLRF